MSTVVAIILRGLIGAGDGWDAKQIAPTCDDKVCTISIEDAQAVVRMQAVQLQVFNQLMHEVAALKKRTSCRGSET